MEQSSEKFNTEDTNPTLLLNSYELTQNDITQTQQDPVLLDTQGVINASDEDSPSYIPLFAQQPNSTVLPAAEKYVLVQTITNDQSNKKPIMAEASSTVSTITTHVDSIESILLQLNNSNHGPSYHIVNQQTPAYNQEQTDIQENTHKTPMYQQHLEEHTMPVENYYDHTGPMHQTSEFNKMPVVGVAYPIDMELFDEEGSIATDKQVLDHNQKLPTTTKTTTLPKISQRPQLITAQNYHTLSSTFTQIPEEVTVSSYTTKVQEPLQYTPLSSSTYKPVSFMSTQYDIISSSSSRPVSSTRKPTRPKPSVKRPTKKPANSEVTKKKPSNTQDFKKVPLMETSTKQPYEQSSIAPLYTSQSYATSTEAILQYSDRPDSINFGQEKEKEENLQLIGSYSTMSHIDKTSQHSNDGAFASGKPNNNVNKFTKKPISTSYVTGTPSPRPPTTFVYEDVKVPPLLPTDDKLDTFVHSTAGSYSSGSPVSPTYQTPVYVGSATPIHIQGPPPSFNPFKPPGFVKIQATMRPVVPTVLITPKPTVLTSSSTQKQVSIQDLQSSAATTLSSISNIYDQLLTKEPQQAEKLTNEASNIDVSSSTPSIIVNNYGNPSKDPEEVTVHPAFEQSTTEASFGVPFDDKPAFPGYYGPTPTYPAFPIPDEKGEYSFEETYTSPNDFVNFPPVRNPNLNMSATSSAVTTDLELSTPAFVEDGVLKNKMNTLVHKIVESLQGNFEALSEMIDDANYTDSIQNYQAGSVTNLSTTRKPTKKPTRTNTTKTKPPTSKPSQLTSSTAKPANRRTTVTTRKPQTRKPTATTRKPSRKTTRKPPRTTTTTQSPAVEEIVDEEDEEDTNPIANEIEQSANTDNSDSNNTGSERKIQCGVRPLMKSGRIVGGKGATFGAYPWQVLVRESTWLGLFTKNKCGGVLITNKYIITAGHCQPG